MDLFGTAEYQRAALVREIAKHPGMEALKDLLREAQRRIGEAALDDKDHPRSWWQGYRIGLGLSVSLLEELTNLANLVDETRVRQAERAANAPGSSLLAQTLIGRGDI
jgi:hypothetical protein